MATSQILSKYLSTTQLSITLGSLGNGAGRISAVIDNTSVRATRGLLSVQLKTGTSPTVNTLIKVYFLRNSNDASNIQDGMISSTATALGTADAAVTTEPTNAELALSIPVTSTTGVTYTASRVIYEPSAKFSVVVWNATVVAFDSTNGSHLVEWAPIADEAQ